MGSHDFEVDLEALGTAVSELSDLQERNRTYDVADYTPNSGMVGDPVVAGALESFSTKWDQGRVQLSVYPSFCLKGLMHDE